MLQMNQNSRRRLSAFILRRDAPSKDLQLNMEYQKQVDAPSKDLQLNMEYQKQVYPIGQNNSAKNARKMKKPKPIIIS